MQQAEASPQSPRSPPANDNRPEDPPPAAQQPPLPRPGKFVDKKV